MKKIAVVYWSGTGNTEAMAQAVVEGAQAAGADAALFCACEFSPAQAAEYAAFAFGCPSMGAEQLEEGEFEPMFSAVKPGLSGKDIVLFGSYGWGSGEWMETWTQDCEDAGCRLAADPVTVCGAPEADCLAACRDLGRALCQ